MRRVNGAIFNTVSISIITFLFTGCIALMIALANATQPASYDRDQAFIKSSIQTNTQNISDLTKVVQDLSVQDAALKQQVDTLARGGK